MTDAQAALANMREAIRGVIEPAVFLMTANEANIILAHVEAQAAEIERLREQLSTAMMDGHDLAKAEYRDEIERLRQWETCGHEWLGKTDWVQERVDAGSWPISALGKHRADVMREEVERLTAERDQLRRQFAQAQQRAEYWKAEHLAGNKEIDDLRRQLAEAGWPAWLT